MIVPFIPAHLEAFEPQEQQRDFHGLFKDPLYVNHIALHGNAMTGMLDGKPMVIAGVGNIYPHIGLAWALISKDANRHLLRATRAFREHLDAMPFPRIEMHVDRDFTQAHRWATMLGFVNETPGEGMKNFGMNGETCDLYARYKPWHQ